MSARLTIDWVAIPAGKFLMGSAPHIERMAHENEQPQHTIDLPEFCMARVPVTNAQYRRFVEATHHPAPGHWSEGRIPASRADYPVTYVDWHDALAFCEWAGVRLPTEVEWEKAARGTDGRLWPWGNRLPYAACANFNNNLGDITPVGAYSEGASPYGVRDMAGNVWEWTASLYGSYPYCPGDGREDLRANGPRVVRGGSYNHDSRSIRCADRQGMYPTTRDVYIGFRVAALPTVEGVIDFDWVTIPGGKTFIGSAPQDAPVAAPNELPQHQVELSNFEISRVPITNEQYAAFVAETGYTPPGNWARGILSEKAHHPVTYVDWDDAQAFCRWAGLRLPTEAEWEKAARGEDGRLYPWGNAEPDHTMLHYARDPKTATTCAVGCYLRGASPYGVLDMAGNVWEWVSSLYDAYPYRSEDGREDWDRREQRVLRGGSYYSGADHVRCTVRSMSYPTRRRDHIGFRVIR